MGIFEKWISVATDDKARSVGSKLSEELLKFAFSEKDKRTVEDTERLIEKARRENAIYTVPAVYRLNYEIKVDAFKGYEFCVFGDPKAKRTVLYLHGGGFIYQPVIFHYRYCKLLANEIGACVIMPIYPLSPDHIFVDTLEWLEDFYKHIILKRYNAKDLFFFGDSAGGGLIMSFCQKLLDDNLTLPKQMIAFSPCLDITFSNPDMLTYQDVDPMLAINDCRQKLLCYIGDGDVKSPYLSPIYADFKRLPKTSVFVGDHEVMIADARKWRDKLRGEKVDFNYYEYPFMNHVFPLYPIPEAREVMELIKTLLNE